jgi:transcriptional regulator with XRE-family HTH domain
MTPKQYQAARKRLGLTHRELADLLGVHLVTSGDYGTRVTPPESIRRLILLIEAIGPERAREVFGIISTS